MKHSDSPFKFTVNFAASIDGAGIVHFVTFAPAGRGAVDGGGAFVARLRRRLFLGVEGDLRLRE